MRPEHFSSIGRNVASQCANTIYRPAATLHCNAPVRFYPVRCDAALQCAGTFLSIR
jgi:hypothetical protein